MHREYMFVFDPKITFTHHVDILIAYLKFAFPEKDFSMFNDCTLLLGNASSYRSISKNHSIFRNLSHLPIRWRHTGECDKGALVQYILDFVSGDPNDTFCMKERILDHGWYEMIAVS